MHKRTVLVRYGEIHLKGLNRPFFERRLKEQLVRSLSVIPGCRVLKGDGRYFIWSYPEAEEGRVAGICCGVFGVHSAAQAVCVDKDIDLICAAAAEQLTQTMREKGKDQTTFKIRTRRSDKRFPLDSVAICAAAGRYVLEHVPGTKVDVKAPAEFVDIEIRDDGAYIYTHMLPGAGGMPLGSNGRALLLLSGGIDSPVAGYLMAKKGVEIEAVHFHSFPYTGEKARQKVISLCRILAQYTGSVTLHLVNLAQIQIAIREKCPEKHLTLIMRRFMARIAHDIAKAVKADALVTGESLGQVASQTIKALAVTESAVDMPILRPCIAMDKQEIVDLAQKIGTLETSTLPYEDCCTLFVPKHPDTKPALHDVEASESSLDAEKMICDALEHAEILHISVD